MSAMSHFNFQLLRFGFTVIPIGLLGGWVYRGFEEDVEAEKQYEDNLRSHMRAQVQAGEEPGHPSKKWENQTTARPRIAGRDLSAQPLK